MPGVPPNAFSKLKQALKGMLKPKKRQDQQEQPPQKQDNQQDAPSKPDVPPKLPPVQPVAAGQTSEPQSTAPKPETSPAQDAGAEGAVKEQAQKQDADKAPVAPAAPAPVAKDDVTKSEPASAVPADHEKPLPLPKTDGAADESQTTAPHPQPSTQDPLPTSSENTKPVSAAPAAPAAPAMIAVPEAQPAAKTSSESARASNEKMPVMAEEPPEIKGRAAAPGMSATSGPLDDFPIDGDKP